MPRCAVAWILGGAAVLACGVDAVGDAVPPAGGALTDAAVAETSVGNVVIVGDDAAVSPVDASPPNYAAAVLADRPIGYWRLDEGPGATTAADHVGPYAGTYANVTLGQTGALTNDGTGASFDGRNSTLTIGSAQLPFTGTSPFTIEAWVNRRVIDDNIRFIVSWGIAGAQRGGDLGLAVRGRQVSFERRDEVAGAGSRHLSDEPIPTDGFHYFVVTYDGTTLSIYVDAMLRASGATTSAITTPGTRMLRFGGTIGDHHYKIDGVMDELAVYDHALTPARISAHFNARH